MAGTTRSMWDGATSEAQRPFQFPGGFSFDVPREMGTYHEGPHTAKRAPDLDFSYQWAPRDPCAFGSPFYKRLEPPPFGDVAFYTQDCFTNGHMMVFVDGLGGGPTWPPEDCDAPCILIEGLPCDIPVPDPSVPQMQIEVPDLAHPYIQSTINYYSGVNAVIPLTRWSKNDEKFAAAAVALLLENIDLVEWVVCLACTWTPDRIPGVAGDPIPDVQAVVDCVLNDIAGGAKIYLVDRTTRWDAMTGTMVLDGAMGWATPGLPGQWDRAVILPTGRFEWEQARDQYLLGLNSGVPNARSLCMVAALAETILHEIMHLCAGVAADDANQCWAVQNMAAISFMWALAQRYPCLQTEGCCPKAGDRYFMTSEPDVPTYTLSIPGGGTLGPFLLACYIEPAPWDFDPSIPC